ncbi:MAG: hypothetical protein AB1631_14905 [Acidobacteriota bacterium]
MNTSIRVVTRAVCFFLFFSAASAQWNKKPYTEWSPKEAQKVLNDSPWGQTQAFADMSNKFSTGPGRTATSSQTQEASTDYLNFRIRFLSAKPIRQALYRMMEAQGKNELDAQTEARLKDFVDSQFAEHIVVSVMVDSRDHKGQLPQAQSLLRSRTASELKNNSYLVLKNGQRVFLQEYYPLSADGLGAKFVFPRLIDGKPFITEELGEVTFYAELSSRYTLRMRFKTKDMIYDGKLEY